MTLDYVVSAFVTLLVVVDPLGLAPSFIALTEGLTAHARRQVAVRACLIAVAILAGVAVIGEWLLASLGISLHAFRIAGGLLLFSIASEMVFGVRIERQSKAAEQAAEEHVRNIAAFPLAIPLMAGPGAITAVVLLSGKTATLAQRSVLIVAAAVVLSLCFLVFLGATRISRYIGHTGNVVASRLLGVLLAALAVQYVIDGVRAVWGP